MNKKTELMLIMLSPSKWLGYALNPHTKNMKGLGRITPSSMDRVSRVSYNNDIAVRVNFVPKPALFLSRRKKRIHVYWE